MLTARLAFGSIVLPPMLMNKVPGGGIALTAARPSRTMATKTGLIHNGVIGAVLLVQEPRSCSGSTALEMPAHAHAESLSQQADKHC